MKNHCTIAVGSTNPTKILATRKAFTLLCTPTIKPVKVESGVKQQPTSLAETIKGALNRAKKAMEKTNADYSVGIEAGTINAIIDTIELQAAVILDRQHKVTIGLSQGFQLPQHWLNQIAKNIELAEIAEKETRRPNIGRKLGVIGYLTQGTITRTNLAYNALIMALTPRLNKNLYHKLPTLQEAEKKLANQPNNHKP